MTRTNDIFQVLRVYEFEPELDNCIGNAMMAGLFWNMSTSLPSEIHNIVVPELGPHAYLAVNKQPFSRGVTWPNSHFPEFAYAELIMQPGHEDITVLTALNMLSAITDNSAFIREYGYSRDFRLSINLEAIKSQDLPDWQDAIYYYALSCLEEEGMLSLIGSIQEIYEAITNSKFI